MLIALSKLAFGAMVAGICGLYYVHAVFAHRPAVIAIQVAAALVMVAARLTFGRRSFHAGANPTEGGLVTSGPYAYVRHPIYASILYFVWAGALDNFSLPACGWAALITAGAIARMLLEERMLTARYPAYADYQRRVRRVVPFVV